MRRAGGALLLFFYHIYSTCQSWFAAPPAACIYSAPHTDTWDPSAVPHLSAKRRPRTSNPSPALFLKAGHRPTMVLALPHRHRRVGPTRPGLCASPHGGGGCGRRRRRGCLLAWGWHRVAVGCFTPSPRHGRGDLTVTSAYISSRERKEEEARRGGRRLLRLSCLVCPDLFRFIFLI